MSVRDTIFEALITRIGAIAPSAGYVNTIATDQNGVKLVLRNVRHSETLVVPNGQVVVAMTDDGAPAVIQYAASGRALLEDRFVAHALVNSTGLSTIPTSPANNMLADLRRLRYLLNATPSLLGANCHAVALDAFPGWNVTDDDAQCVVTFLVTYWIDQNAP